MFSLIQIATVSREATAYVWNLKDGKKKHELKWKYKDLHEKYRFRNCRYGLCHIAGTTVHKYMYCSYTEMLVYIYSILSGSIE